MTTSATSTRRSPSDAPGITPSVATTTWRSPSATRGQTPKRPPSRYPRTHPRARAHRTPTPAPPAGGGLVGACQQGGAPAAVAGDVPGRAGRVRGLLSHSRGGAVGDGPGGQPPRALAPQDEGLSPLARSPVLREHGPGARRPGA